MGGGGGGDHLGPQHLKQSQYISTNHSKTRLFLYVFPLEGNFDIDAGNGGGNPPNPKKIHQKKEIAKIYMQKYFICLCMLYSYPYIFIFLCIYIYIYMFYIYIYIKVNVNIYKSIIQTLGPTSYRRNKDAIARDLLSAPPLSGAPFCCCRRRRVLANILAFRNHVRVRKHVRKHVRTCS